MENLYSKSDEIEEQTSLISKIKEHKIYFIFLLLLFLIEYFFRECLYSLSPSFIIFIQKYLYYLYPIGQFFSFFASENGQFLVLLLSYNFSSTYKTLILVISAGLSSLLGGFLKLIYISPRPFMTDINVSAFNCEGGWGNPSTHSILSTCFYLTFYKIYIFQNKNFSNEEKKKSYIFTFIFIICICLSRLLLGVHSINQILFGFCLGLSLYYLLFYIIELNSNDSNQLYYSISNLYKFILWGFILIIISCVPYFFIHPDSFKINEYDKNLQMKCPGYPNIKKFEHESFTCIFSFIFVITSFIGCYVEFYYIFHNNISNWKRYNFNYDADNEINLLEDNIDNKNKRWNDTELIKSLKRLVFICLVIGIIMIPYFIIPMNLSYSFVLIFKIIIPVSFVTFLMFSYLKRICGKFDLINENILNNSIDV